MPGESLVQQIRQRINFEEFFAEFLTLRGHGTERRAFCIFHENTDTEAMGVNIAEGLFICRNPSCGVRGDFIDFYMRVRSLTFSEAIRELARRVNVEVTDRVGPDTGIIDESVAASAHERLMATPDMLQWLQERRGLLPDTLRAWQIGHDGQRYYIPIRDEAGRLVNIRRYLPNARRAQDKMISWRPSYGNARLWPFDSLARSHQTGDPILLLEGEMDCLLALQMGFCAMTATGGAGTWRESWNGFFRDRDVVICYDADAPGRTGAAHVAGYLHVTARRVRVINLPITEPPGADFTDYIVGHGHAKDDFLRLMMSATAYIAPDQPLEPPPEVEPAQLHLSQASRAEHYNQPIRIHVMVSGKTTAPYIIPRQVVMTCPMPGLRMCERCPVAARAGRLEHRLDFESNELLQFINVSEQTLQKQLKAKVGIPSKCTYAECEVQESMNIEEVQLIPEIDRSADDAPYVTRLAYYTGHGLQANRSYVMTGTTVPTPNRQLATHLIHSAVPAHSNIDAFRLTPQVIEELQVFQPVGHTVDDLWRRLDTVYDDLEQHTRIFMRRDLMLAVDLTYHSLLTFDFQGDRLPRGWVEALIIGDSRTGKTTVVQRMMDYYNAGELVSGENTSLAGLIGGLHQIGDSWALQWGKVPLNDRRLLAVDEAGNLPQEQIARLSSMRSSGVAEVIKVHTERTNSRTRQIWMSNPRGMKPLSSYSQGVLAVKELVGAPEDIARFDLVVTAASSDVTLSVINALRHPTPPRTYTSLLCHQRVMWAWSRSPEQVRWEPDAEAHLLELATEQGERYRYATDIPLVEPNEQRVKLARLAVAAAAMFFSTDEAAGSVIVGREHVDFAYQYLERLYRKPSLAFTDYAETRKRLNEISRQDEVRVIITRNPGAVRQFMEQEQFQLRDLAELLSYDDRDDLRRAVTTLRTAGFLGRQGSSYYYKTPAAIKFLRAELNGHPQYDPQGRFTEREEDDEPAF